MICMSVPQLRPTVQLIVKKFSVKYPEGQVTVCMWKYFVVHFCFKTMTISFKMVIAVIYCPYSQV